MTRSSPSPRARAARTVDELVAVEWDPEDLFGALAEPAAACAAPAPDEQDALIEAIAAANAAREAEVARETERRLEEAYQSGYEDGRQAGEIAEAARLRLAVQVTEQALDALRAGELRWVGTIEENVCALAVAVARQVIDRELKTDPELVADLVRRAVAEFPIDHPLRIRVAPQDHAQITAGSVLPAVGGVDREVRWVSDPVIQQGGCIVEGRERIVDGRVDNALERLYRRLTYTHA